jgi:hypothetical protein
VGDGLLVLGRAGQDRRQQVRPGKSSGNRSRVRVGRGSRPDRVERGHPTTVTPRADAVACRSLGM